MRPIGSRSFRRGTISSVRRLSVFAPSMIVAVGLSGCTTYRDELVRAQSAYEANDHDTALAIERAIEPNAPYLNGGERTRYFYLRGMTDFRLGYRAEARHYLAVARAMESENPGALPTDWKARLNETLTTLDTEVYASGLEALSAHEVEASKSKSKSK
jgi:hypothetical protein